MPKQGVDGVVELARPAPVGRRHAHLVVGLDVFESRDTGPICRKRDMKGFNPRIEHVHGPRDAVAKLASADPLRELVERIQQAARAV